MGNHLDELAPLASQRVVADRIGWTIEEVRANPGDALRNAIATFPSTGRITRKRERLSVKALIWILAEVPSDDPGRNELADSIQALIGRAGGES